MTAFKRRQWVNVHHSWASVIPTAEVAPPAVMTADELVDLALECLSASQEIWVYTQGVDRMTNYDAFRHRSPRLRWLPPPFEIVVDERIPPGFYIAIRQ